MKKAFLFLITLFVLTLNLVSCEKETLGTVAERSLVVLVKDQSASVSNADTEKQTQHLKRYLAQHLSENVDVVVLDINSHSNSRTNTRWFYYKAPKRQESTRNKSEKQMELDETLYQGKVHKVLQATQKKIVEAMDTETASSNQTAIVELMHPITQILKDYDSASVLIYSDFIQESSFRDFTKGQWPMPSKAYATDLATKDFERLQKQGLPIDLSKVVSVDVVTPNIAQNEPYYVNTPFFWDKIFGLGKYNSTINWQKL